MIGVARAGQMIAVARAGQMIGVTRAGQMIGVVRAGQMIGVASHWVSTSRSLSHPFMLRTQYSFHLSLFCSCFLTHCIVLLLAL